MNKNIKFIHCALPNIDFNKILIKENIKIKAECKQITISCLPFIIEINSTFNIKNQILIINKYNYIKLFFMKPNKLFIIYNKKLIEIEEINGINKKTINKNLICVNNGLDAAKYIRLKKYFIVLKFNKIDIIKKQLKVIMFLTNSINIEQLKKAPVVFN